MFECINLTISFNGQCYLLGMNSNVVLHLPDDFEISTVLCHLVGFFSSEDVDWFILDSMDYGIIKISSLDILLFELTHDLYYIECSKFFDL